MSRKQCWSGPRQPQTVNNINKQTSYNYIDIFNMCKLTVNETYNVGGHVPLIRYQCRREPVSQTLAQYKRSSERQKALCWHITCLYCNSIWNCCSVTTLLHITMQRNLWNVAFHLSHTIKGQPLLQENSSVNQSTALLLKVTKCRQLLVCHSVYVVSNFLFLFPTESTWWSWTTGLWIDLHLIAPLRLSYSQYTAYGTT